MPSNQPTPVLAKLFAPVCAAMCIGLAPGCKPASPTNAAPRGPAEPIDVRAVPIEFREVQRGIDVTGTLYADDEAEVAAKTPGRIVSVSKDVGDIVAPGEPLAAVDATDYELLRQQREAALAEALSRLGLDAMPSGEVDLNALPAVKRARAQESNAKARFERGKQLFESDPPLISQQEFADLETSVEVERHNVTAELLAGRTLLSQARSRQVDLQIAEQSLRDTQILAPRREGTTDGYAVARRRIAVGEYVTPGQAVFSLVDANPIKFRADAPERFADVVKVGQTIEVRLEAFDAPFEGRVTRLSPQVDAQSRTFLFEAEIANPERRLKPGSFAIGRVATEKQNGVAFVPASAVVTFAGVKRIFSVQDGKAVEHRVETGVKMDDWIEIASGAPPKDSLIVLEGAHRLTNGAPVTVTMASIAADVSARSTAGTSRTRP